MSTHFPFGFLEKLHKMSLSQDMLVYLNVQPTEQFHEVLPLISGEMESNQKGRGHDLHSIWDYQETDSPRHVDLEGFRKKKCSSGS